jgi:hypothetical protein
MKKLIFSVTAIAGLSLAAHAQQVLFFDHGTANGSIDTEINGVLNTTWDLNLELLVGSSPNSVTTDVVTLLLSQTTRTITTALGTVQPAKGDITDTVGDIFDLSVNGYLVPAGTAYFQVLAWTGNYNSWAAALIANEDSGANNVEVDTGESPVLAFPYPPTPGYPPVTIDLDPNPINLFGALDYPVMPEPSTLTMAGVGIGSMLIFGCRKFVRLG